MSRCGEERRACRRPQMIKGPAGVARGGPRAPHRNGLGTVSPRATRLAFLPSSPVWCARGSVWSVRVRSRRAPSGRRRGRGACDPRTAVCRPPVVASGAGGGRGGPCADARGSRADGGTASRSVGESRTPVQVCRGRAAQCARARTGGALWRAGHESMWLLQLRSGLRMRPRCALIAMPCRRGSPISPRVPSRDTTHA